MISQVISLGLAQTPKLNFSVMVNPACASNTETEVLVACGTPERGFPPLVGQVSLCGGRMYLLYLTQQTMQGLLPVVAWNVWGGVVPHPVKEGGLTAGSRASRWWTAVW